MVGEAVSVRRGRRRGGTRHRPWPGGGTVPAAPLTPASESAEGGRASTALAPGQSVGTSLALAVPPPAPTSAPAILDPDTCPLPLPLPLKDSIARAALPVSLKVGLPLVRSGGGGGCGPPELLVIERGCEQQASNSLLSSCIVEHEVCVRRFRGQTHDTQTLHILDG